MDRIFWVVCPTCGHRYSVDHALRHRADVRLECTLCREKFPVAAATAVEE